MNDQSNNEHMQYLLVKRAAGHLVLEEMGAVRQAVGQIRALVCDAVPALAEAIQGMGESNDPQAQGNAVRSLQFADMVDQLGAYCDAELDNVEHLARDINQLVNDIIDGKPDPAAQVSAFQQSLEGRLQDLRTRLANRGHKSVVQENMDVGDIELF